MSGVVFTDCTPDAAGDGEDPYDDPWLVAALAGTAVHLRRARITVGDGAVELLTVWQPTGSGQLVRSSDYAALRLDGSLSTRELRSARAALSTSMAAEGAVSDVSLIGPFCTHRDRRTGGPATVLGDAAQAELAACWGAAPRKPIAVVSWDDAAPDLATLPGKVRNDLRTGLRNERRWRRFTPEEADGLAEDYVALMDDKDAAARWRLGTAFFAALAGDARLELWVASIHGEDGVARALFARSGRRAAYLFATRRGTARGGPAAALWVAFEGLQAIGVRDLLLGGGVSDEPDDSLWRFKRRFATRTCPLYLGAHLFDECGHRRAVEDGLARPLPSPCTVSPVSAAAAPQAA